MAKRNVEAIGSVEVNGERMTVFRDTKTGEEIRLHHNGQLELVGKGFINDELEFDR